MGQFGQGEGYVGTLTLAQLAGFGDSYIVEGDQVYVTDQNYPYVYRLTFGAPDGVNIVKSLFIAGAWVKQQITAVPGRIKSLQNGVPLPLLQVDVSQVQPSDNTFAARLQFAAQVTDGTDSQIRQGDCNSAVAYKPSTGVFATSQAQNATNAFTVGNLTTTFAWTTVGTVATLTVTVTTTLAVPIDFKFHFNVVFATHAQFTFP